MGKQKDNPVTSRDMKISENKYLYVVNIESHYT